MNLDAVVRTLAAWDLKRRPDAGPIELSSADWSALLATVRDQRLEGLLARARWRPWVSRSTIVVAPKRNAHTSRQWHSRSASTTSFDDSPVPFS